MLALAASSSGLVGFIQANRPEVNGLICAGIFLFGFIALIWQISARWRQDGALAKHRASLWAYMLWLTQWGCVALVYGLIANKATDEAVLFASNSADMASLMFVIAYATGNSFKWTRLIPGLVGTVLAGAGYAVWYFWSASLSLKATPLTQLLLISPSILVGGIAEFLSGWVFLVRWGTIALPLFLLLVLYSMAQAPAHIGIFIHNGVIATSTPALESLGVWMLAGKLLIAVYGFGLFFATNDEYPPMRTAQFFPSASAGVHFNPMHKSLRTALWWILITTIAAVVTVIVERAMGSADYR